MVNLKRLILKKFGGISNFFLFILFVFVVYLYVRNYLMSSSYQKDSELEQNLFDGIKKQDDNHIKEEDYGAHLKSDLNTPEVQKPKKPPRHPIDPLCEIEEKCPDEAIPYKVISGEGMSKYPLICFNGKLIMEKNMKENKIGRGINLVVIDKNNYEIKLVDSFDTFEDDSKFLRTIKTNTNDGDIVILASYDEMTNGLKEPVRTFMTNFGTQLFGNIKFRDSFVMIGQRGVDKGKAVELLELKGKRDFALQAKISGCTTFPLGVIKPVKVIEMQVNSLDQIVIGSVVKNCGLKVPCKNGEFPVHVYTGKDQNDEPKICVDGRYVIAKGVNDAGRGINIVLIGNGKEILKTAHFDTFSEDSTNLEIFLEGIGENVIIIAVTFDEASTKLGTLARSLFFELGSGLIQNLKFRDAWYFVGRKNLSGFSPIEEISYTGADNAYPKPLDTKFCVPQTLKGLRIRPDPLPIMNDKRRDFCSRYDGYGDFCVNENIDKPLNPVPIINETLNDHPVYNIPILVIGSMSHNSLRMTLETLIMQPGIRRDIVYVCLDEKLDEMASLVELFGFQYIQISSSYGYIEIFHKALEKVWTPELIRPEVQALIVIEEDLILSPDFLYFFAQVYDIFIKDAKLAAVSAWNSNSYQSVDGSESYVYRVNDFPGLGFMLKRSAYDKYMKGNLATCCSKRAWYNWKTIDSKSKQEEAVHVLIPDVSRVFRRPYDTSTEDFSFLDKLFNQKRKTNLIPFPNFVDLHSLESEENYNKYLKKLLSSSLEIPDVSSCLNTGKIQLPTTESSKNSSQSYKYIFKQSEQSDLKELVKICKCFGLFWHEMESPKSIYSKSILRFNSHGNNYILVGDKNPILNN